MIIIIVHLNVWDEGIVYPKFYQTSCVAPPTPPGKSPNVSDLKPPSDTASHHQKNWDLPKVLEITGSLLEKAPNSQSQARLWAAPNQESGEWFCALPGSSLGLWIDDNTIWVAVGLRLGIPLCHSHQCSPCGAEVDNLATHGATQLQAESRRPSSTHCTEQHHLLLPIVSLHPISPWTLWRSYIAQTGSALMVFLWCPGRSWSRMQHAQIHLHLHIFQVLQCLLVL